MFGVFPSREASDGDYELLARNHFIGTGRLPGALQTLCLQISCESSRLSTTYARDKGLERVSSMQVVPFFASVKLTRVVPSDLARLLMQYEPQAYSPASP